MLQLGNHPNLETPVSIKIRFEDFDNTVVIAGKYTLLDVIKFLESSGYIENKVFEVEVFPVYYSEQRTKLYCIQINDDRLLMSLSEFEKNCLKMLIIL